MIYDIYPTIIRDLLLETAGGTGGVPPSMVHVSGDIWAIASGRTADRDARVFTVTISGAGATIGAMSWLDELEIEDAITCYDPRIIFIAGDVYAVAYSDNAGSLRLVTVSINPATGAIAPIDGPDGTGAVAQNCSLIKIDTDVVALVAGNGAGGTIVRTWDVSDAGAIGLQIDTFTFAGTTNQVTIVNVAPTIYAVATQTNGANGVVFTIDIDAAGNIGGVELDSLVVGGGIWGDIFLVGANMVAFWEGDTLTTLGIDNAGNIDAAVTDTWSPGAASYRYQTTHITGIYYAVAYRAAAADGFYVSTIDISAAGVIAAATGAWLSTSAEFPSSTSFSHGARPILVSAAATGLLAVPYLDHGFRLRIESLGIGDWVLPSVTTQAVTVSTLVANGTVVGAGAPIGSAHGFCWNTTGAPTLADSFTDEGVPGVGPFSSIMPGIIPGQLYYVRAYVTNAITTVYGNQVSFIQGPTITTEPFTNLYGYMATGNGTIVALNGNPVTEHGHCWALTPNPTIADSRTTNGAAGVGAFTSAVTGLISGVVYHGRAYATNADATSYGNDVILVDTPTLAYVLAEWDDSLSIFEVSDPTTTPKFIGNIMGSGAPNYLNGCRGIKIIGDYAYVASYDDDALSIFNISDPTLPILVGSIQGAGAPPGGNWLNGAQGLDVVGDLAYVACGGDEALTIINIADPSAPYFVGSIQAGGVVLLDGAFKVSIVGSYAYVTSEFDGSLTVIDVSDPTTPTFVGSLDGWGAPNFLGRPWGIAVEGDYAYITAGDDDSLTIINISNPLVPVYVGRLDGSGAPNWLNEARDVVLIGDRAFVVSRRDDSLTIINITNPALPTLVGVIRGAGIPNYLDYPWGIFVLGDYAYIAAHDEYSLTIIDISNPAVPAFSSHIEGSGVPNYLSGAAAVYVAIRPAGPVPAGGSSSGILALLT